MQQSPSAVSARPLAYYVRKLARMTWNVATMSETGRLYFAKVHRMAWSWIYARAPRARPVIAYGRFVHRRICRQQVRVPSGEHTFFLRNEPHFDVLRDVVIAWPTDGPFRVASVGCSTGAELYGAEWVIDRARPNAPLVATGVDISPHALECARAGRYARSSREFERLTPREIEALIQGGLFAADGDVLAIHPAFVRGTRWLCLDARSPELHDRVGACDFVFVNNMLCHLHDDDADACMTNIGGLVAPGGYLFTYGVDLDVKTRVVNRLGLRPVMARLEDVYEADWKARLRWPFTYWGREPLDHRRRDWAVRYGSVFTRPAG